jgi:hypothetical protein
MEVSCRLYEFLFILFPEIPRHFYIKERLGKISLLLYELYICNGVSSSLAPDILVAKCLPLADRNFSGTAGCV